MHVFLEYIYKQSLHAVFIYLSLVPLSLYFLQCSRKLCSTKSILAWSYIFFFIFFTPISYVDVCGSAICVKKKIYYISREINVFTSYVYIRIFTRLISLGLRYT